jgi:hypothetical protein
MFASTFMYLINFLLDSYENLDKINIKPYGDFLFQLHSHFTIVNEVHVIQF